MLPTYSGIRVRRTLNILYPRRASECLYSLACGDHLLIRFQVNLEPLACEQDFHRVHFTGSLQGNNRYQLAHI